MTETNLPGGPADAERAGGGDLPPVEPRPMDDRPSVLTQLPPCEDTPGCHDEKDPDRFTERHVLAAHGTFRSEVKGLVAMMAAVPLAALPLAWGLTVVLEMGGVEAAQSTWLALCFVGLAALAAVALIWLMGTHRVERRFAAIRRHALVAAEGVSVDDQTHSVEAIEALMRTWAYRQFLFRWLQDVRFVVVAYGATIFALAIGAVAFMLDTPVLDWAGATATGVVVLACGALPSVFAVMLTREAHRHQVPEPTASIASRFAILMAEVKELRRGRRIAR